MLHSFHPPGRRSGAALIIVLSVLVLLTVLAVGFFSGAASDLVVAKSYSDDTRVKLLGKSAVNVVEGQIAAATQGGTTATPLAWTSQPGLIRTFDTTGKETDAFKLYSSDVLHVANENGDAFNPNSSAVLGEEIPANWNTRPSDFVDLNSPVLYLDPKGLIRLDPAGPLYTARFPIVDGNSLASLGENDPVSGNPLYSYDVNGDGKPDVEGFGVAVPTGTTFVSSKPIGPNNNPVPMPVRWLYMLQDGQLQPRTGTGQISGASKDNPPVARIAFWTDDDTCKLNVNTASEGTPWDRPRARNNTEVAYSLNVPAQNEFQSFPGHPAKTSLSTVFGSLWKVPSFVTSLNYNQLLPYYDLAPRVTKGGSQGATQSPKNDSVTGIPYDADRLYSSVDELVFNTAVSATSPPTRTTRDDSASNPYPVIKPAFLETSKFFLTASNRAPEVTLLNTPRVSLWPLQVNANLRTAKEQLLAFCATVPVGSSNAYYFQRFNSTVDGNGNLSSMSVDKEFDGTTPSGQRNNTLYQYLRRLVQSDVPGLGGNFAAKYGNKTDQILTEMVDFMRSGLNTITTKSDNSGSPTYGYTQSGQVIPLQFKSNGKVTSQGFGRYCTISEVAIDFFRCNDPNNQRDPTTGKLIPGGGPIQIGAVVMLQPFCPSPGFSSVKPEVQIEIIGLDKFTIRSDQGSGARIGKLGLPAIATNVLDAPVGFSALGNLTASIGLETQFLYYKPGVGNTVKNFDSGATTGDDSVYPFFNTPSQYPEDTIATLPKNATSFDFNPPDSNGSASIPITINIYTRNTGSDAQTTQKVLIQTLHLEFPSSLGLPIPEIGKSNTGANIQGTPATIFPPRVGSDGQKQEDGTIPPYFNNPFNLHNLIGKQDVVRSMVVDVNGPSKGDLRMIAALNDVSRDYFIKHPSYDYTPSSPPGASAIDPNPIPDNRRFAHSLRTGDNPGYGSVGWYNYGPVNPTPNYLVPSDPGVTPRRKSMYAGMLCDGFANANNPPYGPEAFPVVPVGLNGAKLTGRNNTPYDGDWDTGNGSLEDGPYINKPDEGNSLAVQSNATETVYYSRSFAATENGQTYSPNREVSSAVIFGSLPTGIDPSPTAPIMRPWQTLLFNPNPAANDVGTRFQHPGFGVSANSTANTVPAPPYTTVPDHYILDLFTMPIVEPYAISEPLSSQGKVNMNFRMAPFNYIRRDTGVRAVLKGTQMLAIPSSRTALMTYKSATGAQAQQYRYRINPDEEKGTLKSFEDRFADGGVFRSASEICSVPLVAQYDGPQSDSPQSYDPSAPTAEDCTYQSIQQFWSKCRLTGDNAREQPYGDIYPRLTTKSNTFTVHVRVQTLKKVSASAQTTFVDPTDTTPGAKDVVTAEYRGSYQIERYIDPNLAATAFPDYASEGTGADPISKFYKFRTLSVKDF